LPQKPAASINKSTEKQKREKILLFDKNKRGQQSKTAARAIES